MTNEKEDYVLGIDVDVSPIIDEDMPLESGWQHVAVTFDSPDLNFYLNGEPAERQTLTGVNTNANDVYARIGWDSDGEYDYFEGQIDNVMIFDRALNIAEIVALAEAANENVLSVAATVYDEAGNLTVDYRGYQYSYDYENRLIEVKDNDDTSIVEYSYDALGRRIQKDDKIAGQKTRYYNNHNWQVLAEYDENGYHLRSYIYGSYIDEVLVMVDPNAAQDYYYAHNHLYSPTALIDDAGAVLERYDYDAYGRPYFLDPNLALSATQSSAYQNTYLFTGRRIDILDNGNLTLQYNRNRYYDYHTGRWLTKDPAGRMGGFNLYEYVNSKPITKLDPRGIWGEDFHRFLTGELAYLAGFCDFTGVGDWCNWPDEEYNPPDIVMGYYYWSLLDLLSAILLVDRPSRQAALEGWADLFCAVQYYHFPLEESGGVVAGGEEARSGFDSAIETCNFSQFGKELHRLQDSYAHRTKREDEHPPHHIHIADMDFYLGHSVCDEDRDIDWELIAPYLSTDADDMGTWQKMAYDAALATYEQMLAFLDNCPEYGCKDPLDPEEIEERLQYMFPAWDDPEQGVKKPLGSKSLLTLDEYLEILKLWEWQKFLRHRLLGIPIIGIAE